MLVTVVLVSVVLIGAGCSVRGASRAGDEAHQETSSLPPSTTAGDALGEHAGEALVAEPRELDPLPAGCDEAGVVPPELKVALRHSSRELITPTPVHVLEGIQQYLRQSGTVESIDEIVVLDPSIPLTAADLDDIALVVDYDQVLHSDPSVIEAIEQSCAPLLPALPQPPYLDAETAWVLPALTPGRPALADLVAAEAAAYSSVGIITGTGAGMTDVLAEALAGAVMVEAIGSPVGSAADQPPSPDDIEALLAADPDIVIIDSLCKANGELLVDAGYGGQIWYLLPDCSELVVFAADTPASPASWLVGPSIIDESIDSPFKRAATAALDAGELDRRTGLIGWNIGWYVEQLLRPINGVRTRQTVLTNAHSIDAYHPHLAVTLETDRDSEHVVDQLFWHKLKNQTWRYELAGPNTG